MANKPLFSAEFQSAYMGLAKHVATMKNSCYSRQIGTVIVDPTINKVSSIGWNGPPRKFPKPDSREYLRDYFWPQLSEKEQELVCEKVAKTERELGLHKSNIKADPYSRKEPISINSTFFSERALGCKTCPRRLVNAGPGERSELCPCVHSELNAILNAGCSLKGHSLFCYSNVGPCQTCASAMCQVQLAEVYFLCGMGDYHLKSIDMLTRCGVKYWEVKGD